MEIPWNSLGIIPHTEWKIGLDIFNNDRDGNEFSVIGWSGNIDNYFNDTMQYGTVKFSLKEIGNV
jgi:hypothetical protein